MIDLELVKAAYEAEAEKALQENIVAARDYDQGDHNVTLTKRQEEYLGFNLSKQRFAVNYCATVVEAPAERMIVQGFDAGEDEAFSEWCWDVWQANRMDAKQMDIHHDIVNEGEYFVLVDWPEGAEFPRFLPHARYTDAELGGTGDGCKAHYVNDNPHLGLECVSKRWTETYTDDKGKRRTRSRLNLYYGDRVERYITATAGRYKDAGWQPFTEVVTYIDEDGQTIEEEKPPVVAWVDKAKRPLGIPFAHFRKPGKLELWDAIPLQDLINKTALDLIATADAAGFPIRVAKGFTPTTDGKPPESDGDNYLEVFPGCWIVIPAGSASEASVDVLPPADITGILATLDSLIIKLAQVTDTPVSRFQLTRQVAAEGTLKQQDGPLLAKIRSYETHVGNGWEDVFTKARRLAEARGIEVGEGATLRTKWEPAETRDEFVVLETLEKKALLGVPREQLWSEMGYDADQIAQMRTMAAEEMQQHSNIGGALLEQFERGV